MENFTADDMLDFVFYRVVDDIVFLTLADQQERENKPQLTKQQIKWLEMFINQYGGSDV